ncbi:hypothetical protein TIFTF001_022710 [Ficus carica]|uniref:Uncharacterized protein n=1 Tax=Ficus carica TaxID=3494 RepID=A0AA88AIB2_FICCA|nr:hypothetical protein TIFTF001_022710 [Ficus carica]
MEAMALGLSEEGGLFQNPPAGGENESHCREIRTMESGADPLHATGELISPPSNLSVVVVTFSSSDSFQPFFIFLPVHRPGEGSKVGRQREPAQSVLQIWRKDVTFFSSDEHGRQGGGGVLSTRLLEFFFIYL